MSDSQIYSLMKSNITLCIFLSLVFWSPTLSAQTEVELNTESYHIGSIMDGEAVLLDQVSGFRDWVTAHTGSGERGAALNFSSDLVMDRRSGWNYHASWTEGTQQYLMRFQLIQQEDQLLLLEVGSYQTCICEGCTGLSFKADMPGCECETGTCEYLMGETLH